MTFNEQMAEWNGNGWRADTRFGLRPISREVDYQIGTMGYNQVRIVKLHNIGTAAQAELTLRMDDRGKLHYTFMPYDAE